jgi:hypothetical protein
MTLNERIDTLVELGDYIRNMEGELEFVIRQAFVNNPWFIVDNIKKSLTAIESQYLSRQELEKWTAHYEIPVNLHQKTVGLILAGNIPLVGFQDIINVFVAGHTSLIKLSDKDRYLITHLIKKMVKINPASESYFKITGRLADFDAVIATGSNNTARYFESYFGKYPNIIRKNRNAVAIITGKETDEDFKALSEDIFTYFGLGCRNIAKIYVPKDYDFNHLLEILHERKTIVNHNKYKNNFDYNMAFHILNRTPFYNNGCIILIESEVIPSRIAQLNYEYYDNLEELSVELVEKSDQIQCIASKNTVNNLSTVAFGSAQTPSLMDYADGIDTMKFLIKL